MTEAPQEIQIIDVHRLSAGLLVYFSDGTSALFQARFLYRMQDHDGNLPITREGGERI